MKDLIHQKLMQFCRTNASDIIVPNFFVGNWEVDVLRIIKSGYWTEYEIKTSRSDFKADFKKKAGWFETNKHYQIKNGQRCNRFFFVVPDRLIALEECPKYAGLIYFKDGRFEIVKSAKLLHKDKFTLNFHELSQKLSFREQHWKFKYQDLKRQSERVLEMQKEIDRLQDENRERYREIQEYRWKERMLKSINGV